MFNNPQFHSIFGLKFLAEDPQEIEIISPHYVKPKQGKI